MWSYIKIILWEIAFAPIWFITYPFRGKRDNCLMWALDKWDNEGGYIAIRWCRHSKYRWIRWPHFLWLPDEYGKYLQHIVPENEEEHRVPHPWFDPVLKHGDDNDTIEN